MYFSSRSETNTTNANLCKLLFSSFFSEYDQRTEITQFLIWEKCERTVRQITIFLWIRLKNGNDGIFNLRKLYKDFVKSLYFYEYN